MTQRCWLILRVLFFELQTCDLIQYVREHSRKYPAENDPPTPPPICQKEVSKMRPQDRCDWPTRLFRLETAWVKFESTGRYLVYQLPSLCQNVCV